MAQWISNRKDQLKSFAYDTDKGQEIKMAKKKCVSPFRDTFPAVQCHSHPRGNVSPKTDWCGLVVKQTPTTHEDYGQMHFNFHPTITLNTV